MTDQERARQLADEIGSFRIRHSRDGVTGADNDLCLIGDVALANEGDLWLAQVYLRRAAESIRGLVTERTDALCGPPQLPSDGTCVRCGSAPRHPSSGLCATCLDEDAERLENSPRDEHGAAPSKEGNGAASPCSADLRETVANAIIHAAQDGLDACEQAVDALSAISAAGYVIVPREPTEVMVRKATDEAARRGIDISDDARNIVRAALADREATR